jgi:hypothetical protein
MSNVQIMTGNQAAALGAKLCNVEVIAAYPITPQSQLSEILSQYVESGELKAEYVRVEGEHSALTVCISASTVGARVFTATSANGLLYMHEQLTGRPVLVCPSSCAASTAVSVPPGRSSTISRIPWPSGIRDGCSSTAATTRKSWIRSFKHTGLPKPSIVQSWSVTMGSSCPIP